MKEPIAQGTGWFKARRGKPLLLDDKSGEEEHRNGVFGVSEVYLVYFSGPQEMYRRHNN